MAEGKPSPPAPPVKKKRGRPKGSKNRGPSKAMRTMLAERRIGELPHEFLRRIALGKKIGDHVPSFEQRMQAAKEAAPYYAPRFTSVEHKNPPIDITKLTDEQLALLARALEPFTFVGGDQDGAAPTPVAPAEGTDGTRH